MASNRSLTTRGPPTFCPFGEGRGGGVKDLAEAQHHADGPGGAGVAQGCLEFAVDARGVPVHHHQVGGKPASVACSSLARNGTSSCMGNARFRGR